MPLPGLFEPRDVPGASRSPRGLLQLHLVILALVIAARGASAALPGTDLFPRGIRTGLDQPGNVLISADFSGDGHPDVAVAHERHALVSVLLFDPAAGGFGPAESHPVGLSPVFLSSGDLDADGDIDVLVVNTGASSVTVLTNDGQGKFAVKGDVPFPAGESRTVQVANLDGDRYLDAFVGNLSTKAVSVMHGNGDGTFVQVGSLPFESEPHSIGARDFDGDGKIDLAVPVWTPSMESSRIRWFRGRGDASFEERPLTLLDSHTFPRYTVAGDFDLDGLQDYVIVDFAGTLFSVRNLGNWQFDVRMTPNVPPDPATQVEVNSWYSFIAALDAEGDGDLDIVTRIQRLQEPGFRIYENDGHGSFTIREDYLLTSRFGSLAMADFDGDGILDLAATWTAAEVRFFKGLDPWRFAMREVVPYSFGPKGVAALPGEPRLIAHGSFAILFLELDGTAKLRPTRSLDFTGRTFEDLVVGNLDGSPPLDAVAIDSARGDAVLLLRGPGESLETPAVPLGGDFPAEVAVGDLDGDGVDDVAAAHWVKPRITVLLGPGRASPALPEAVPEIPLDGQAHALAMVDVDADGLRDIVAATDETLTAFFGDGTGRFPESRTLSGGFRFGGIRASDLDGDGATDLVVAADSALRIFPGGGKESRAIQLGFSARAMEVADVSGDGRPDVLLAAPDSQDVVAVLVARGDFEFDPADRYETGSGVTDLAIYDLDGDGRPDLATSDMLSRTVSVHRGLAAPASAPFRRGDSNGDGQVNLTDAVAVLNSLFLGAGDLPCPDSGDADDDGKLVLTDAVYVLLHLFLGGAAPPPPGPDACGADPTADDLAACSSACS